MNETNPDRPPIHVFNILSERQPGTFRGVCDGLVNGYIYLADQFETVKVEPENIWTADPLRNRSWRFWSHCLIMNEHLVNGYEKYGDERYLNTALAYLWSWKRHNFPASNSEMAWHDHSTALRLIIICKLFEAWRIKGNDDQIFFDFYELAEFHCQKLADPDFYMKQHNHGMDQDIALYIGSSVFNEMQAAGSWKELSLSRFWLQVENLFASDGSYLEHSPSYSYLLCDRFLNFMEFLKEQADPEYIRLEEVISNQLDFLSHILQPDGQIPPIGDGNASPLRLKPLQKASKSKLEELKYVVSGGKEGSPPGGMDKLFPVGGYAMFRNQWNYDVNTVQLVFCASFHSRVHKHHDDLSFTLFGYGCPLLVDAGKFNYNYDSPERQYVVSTRAHNTVWVDESETDLSRLNIGKVGITGYFSGKEVSFVSGLHHLYQGITHLRMVLFFKPWNILLLDWLKGYRNHRFEQIFNFEPSVQCRMDGQSMIGTSNNDRHIMLSPLPAGRDIQTKLVKGDTTPLRGWYSAEYNKLTPAWSGSYITFGEECRIATSIILNPNEQRLGLFEWQPEIIRVGWENKLFTISWRELQDLQKINFNPVH